MATEGLIDLLKATVIWFISKLELGQAYTLGLSLPIYKMGIIIFTFTEFLVWGLESPKNSYVRRWSSWLSVCGP